MIFSSLYAALLCQSHELSCPLNSILFLTYIEQIAVFGQSDSLICGIETYWLFPSQLAV